MIDARQIEVRSIEELIQALQPVKAEAFNATRPDAALSELRSMRSNISAVLSFTSYSMTEGMADDPEFQYVVDEVRRECLLINGMITRIMFRQRWLLSAARLEDLCDVLTQYENLAGAACRMCLLFAPELSNNLLSAF